MTVSVKPWSKLPGETAKAYHAFTHYRDLPAYGRSLAAAYQEHYLECLGRDMAAKRVARRWHIWSSKNSWVSRSSEHDEDLSQRRREERAEQITEARKRHETIFRGALQRFVQRATDIAPEEIPPAALAQGIKVLAAGELQSMGVEESLSLKLTSPADIDLSALNEEERAALTQLLIKLDRSTSQG